MKPLLGSEHNANELSAYLAKLETALIAISSVAMVAIMCIVVMDVVLRYFFHSAQVWSYSVIEHYLVGAVFFLALSDALHRHAHIALDIVVNRFPRRLFHFMQTVGYGISTAFIGLITWLGYLQFEEALINNDRLASIVPLPTWVSYAFLTVGMATMCLRCFYRSLFHAVSFFVNKDMVELPPPPASDDFKPGEQQP